MAGILIQIKEMAQLLLLLMEIQIQTHQAQLMMKRVQAILPRVLLILLLLNLEMGLQGIRQVKTINQVMESLILLLHLQMDRQLLLIQLVIRQLLIQPL